MPAAITILQLLVQYGPAVAQAAQRILSSGTEPTQAEWDAIFARAEKSASQYRAEAEARFAARNT